MTTISSSGIASTAYDFTSNEPANTTATTPASSAPTADSSLPALLGTATALEGAGKAGTPIQELAKALVSLVTTLVALLGSMLGQSPKVASAGTKDKAAAASNDPESKSTQSAATGSSTYSAQDASMSAETAKAASSAETDSVQLAGDVFGLQELAGKTESAKNEEDPSKKASSSETGKQVATDTSRRTERLQALTDDKGAVSVLTPDGFTVKTEGAEQGWTISGPDGKSTRIWGDPHVNESDGDKWNFKDRSTFNFGANKVTVETVPAGNGETFTARITIYSGDERVTIDGIQSNKPRLIAVGEDGREHDSSLDDGNTYERGATKGGESWALVKGRKRDVQGH